LYLNKEKKLKILSWNGKYQTKYIYPKWFLETKIIKENNKDYLVLKLKEIPKYKWPRVYLSDRARNMHYIRIIPKLNEIKVDKEKLKVYKQGYKILKITDWNGDYKIYKNNENVLVEKINDLEYKIYWKKIWKTILKVEDSYGKSKNVEVLVGEKKYLKKYDNTSKLAKYKSFYIWKNDDLWLWIVLFEIEWNYQEVWIKYEWENGEILLEKLEKTTNNIYEITIDKGYSKYSASAYKRFLPYFKDTNWKVVYYNTTNYLSFELNWWEKWLKTNSAFVSEMCNLNWIQYKKPDNAECVQNDKNNAWKCDIGYWENLTSNKCVKLEKLKSCALWGKFFKKPNNAQCVTNDKNNAWKCDTDYSEFWNLCIWFSKMPEKKKVVKKITSGKKWVIKIRKQGSAEKIVLYYGNVVKSLDEFWEDVKEKLIEINDKVPYDAIINASDKMEKIWATWVVIWWWICISWAQISVVSTVTSGWILTPAWVVVTSTSCLTWWAVAWGWAAIWVVWMLMWWAWNFWKGFQSGGWSGKNKFLKGLSQDKLDKIKKSINELEISKLLGFQKINNQFSHGQKIFYSSTHKKYISKDIDKHNWWFWKMANSIMNIW